MSAPATVQASLSSIQARVAHIESRLGVTSNRRATSGSGTASFADVLGRVTGGGRWGTRSSVSSAEVTSAAQAYVGIPYVWGGTDPATGLDCSGFTQHLMRRFGVELPRVSADQLRTGTPVASLAEAQPGDLIGWDTGPRNVGADHVAVYLGNGLMAEAPGTGGHVQIVPVDRTPTYIRRVLPQTGSVVGASGIGGLHPVTGSNVGAGGAQYAQLFEQAGARYGVDPTLLSLIAQKESGFNPRAVSPAGAQGLMQLMPGTAQGLGVSNPFDPAQAIDGAARLLKGHLDTFGQVDLALAAYNAGPGNVRRYGGVPPFAETQSYVAWITQRYGGTGRWT